MSIGAHFVRVPGFRFQVSGSRFQVSGFEFEIWISEFQALSQPPAGCGFLTPP